MITRSRYGIAVSLLVMAVMSIRISQTNLQMTTKKDNISFQETTAALPSTAGLNTSQESGSLLTTVARRTLNESSAPSPEKVTQPTRTTPDTSINKTVDTVINSTYPNEAASDATPQNVLSQTGKFGITSDAVPSISGGSMGSGKLRTALISPESRFAYVFAIWRVDPAKSNYKGYLASLLVNARLLRKLKTNADIVAVFKIHLDSTYEELPPEETALLEGMGVKIHYLPKQEDDRHWNIYATMFHKFTIFSLTQYKYVLYLDCDLMVMNNLDYLMEMAEEGTLKNNVMLASNREPSNGGFLIVQPNQSHYDNIQRIIAAQGPKLGKGKEWDEVIGWGHTIREPDFWQTNIRGTQGTRWSFWAANVDQGFIYHYCKYVIQDCTQILARKVFNFGRSPINGSTIVERDWIVSSKRSSPFWNRTKRAYDFFPGDCGHMTGYSDSPKDWPGCLSPYVDFNHFTGRSKPWKETKRLPKKKRVPHSSTHLWWHTFMELRDDEGLNISILEIPLPY